jgi:hypothetical protein
MSTPSTVHLFDIAGVERESGQYGGPHLIPSEAFVLSRIEIRDENGTVLYSGLPTADGSPRVVRTFETIGIEIGNEFSDA